MIHGSQGTLNCITPLELLIQSTLRPCIPRADEHMHRGNYELSPTPRIASEAVSFDLQFPEVVRQSQDHDGANDWWFSEPGKLEAHAFVCSQLGFGGLSMAHDYFRPRQRAFPPKFRKRKFKTVTRRAHQQDPSSKLVKTATMRIMLRRKHNKSPN